MEIKNTIVTVIVLILIGAAAAWVSFIMSPKPVETPKPEEQQPVQQQPAVSIEDKKITDQTAPFNINITYPYIAGFDEFNNKIQDIISKNTNDFKTNSLQNDEAVKKTDPQSYAKYPRKYDLTVGYDKGEVDGNIVSVVLNVYSFVGGAHGSTTFIPINFDVKNKKEITLADLFPGQTDYLQKVSDYCIPNLKAQITVGMEDNGQWVNQNASWINNGAGPKAENYSIFLINNNNITFYFPEYTVAPYAAGSFKCQYAK